MPFLGAFDNFLPDKVGEAFVREGGFIRINAVFCWQLQRAVTLKTFVGLLSKVYQVMYSPSPIRWQCFKAHTSYGLQDIWLTSLKCPNLQRAITLEIFVRISSNANQVIIFYQLTKFKHLAQASSWQVQNLKRAITHEIFYRIYSIIYNLFHHLLTIHYRLIKFQAPGSNNVFDIFVTIF